MRLTSIYNTQKKALQLPERINLKFLKFKRIKWKQLKFRIVSEKRLKYRILKILKKVRIKNNRKKPFYKKIKVFSNNLKKKDAFYLKKKHYRLKWNKRPILGFLRYSRYFKRNNSNNKIKSKRVNNLFIFCKKLDRIKKYHKMCLGTYHSYNCFYNGAMKSNQISKLFTFDKDKEFIRSFLKCMIKPILRLDILLWNLNFVSSVFHAKEFIRKRFVKVNDKVVNYSFFLKKGDIITFSDNVNKKNFCVRKNMENLSKNYVLLNFFEIDFYTHTIIIVKDLSFLTYKDITLLMSFYYDIKRMKYYLFR